MTAHSERVYKMKKTFLRLSALILTLSIMLTMLGGCNIIESLFKKDNSENNVENNDTPNSNDTPDTQNPPSTDEPLQIKTSIYDIAKHGNLILYMYGSELFEKGFKHGDIVEIAVAGKTYDVPLCSNYADVDNGAMVLRASSEIDGVVLAINMGDFATSAGIATKTKIDEEPGYRWDYIIDSPVEITITMKEAGGYREEWLIRQLVRTNERADYSHLTDEEFANFRVINTTGMGNGVLYRSSSPINPTFGRNTYADKAAENAGILTVVNLADPSNVYENAEDTYYSTCKVTYVNLGTDFLSEATLNGIATGMRFIIDNDGPYMIHCNEGRDRAGFVIALLECLMGATIDEVIDDYMLTYYNYFGVVEGTEKYDVVLKNSLIKVLNTTFKVDDVYKADLVKEAKDFLTEDAGLTEDEVAILKGKLGITLQEVYDAGKDFASLLGDHDNVYVQVTSNGTLLWEEYLSKEYCYSYYGPEYLDLGFEYSSFATDSCDYYCIDNVYSMGISLNKNGIVNTSGIIDLAGSMSFIASSMINDEATFIEKDGFIIVSCTADLDEIYVEDGVISCVETYTIDVKTREMVAVKTTYTYIDGTVEEGIVTISRDVETPEGVKPYLAYANTTDMRTVTIVSNPGTENEKIDTVQAPKGLLVAFSAEWDIEESFDIYADAECTQLIEDDVDLNSDMTVYIKWCE